MEISLSGPVPHCVCGALTWVSPANEPGTLATGGYVAPHCERCADLASKLGAAEKMVEAERSARGVVNGDINLGLAAHIKELESQLERADQELHDTLHNQALLNRALDAESRLDAIKNLVLDWYHNEDCDGYIGADHEGDLPDCSCGVGGILREVVPSCRVFVEPEGERAGLSRVVETRGQTDEKGRPMTYWGGDVESGDKK